MIKYFSGLNWTKIALYAVIAVALAGGGWLMGANHERVQCAEEHAKDIAVLMEYQKGQIEVYNKELKDRIIVADTATRRYYELQDTIKATQGGINEEIAKRAPAASCGPTDREYSLYEEAANRTRHP